MGIINGNQYINRINQLHPDIWLEGKKIQEKLSEHKAFKGVMKSQAALFELQHDQSLSETLTYKSPLTGNKVGTSFMIPTSKMDLKKKREMVQTWARTNAGLMGRSPDYMNTVLAALAGSASLLDGEENSFPENLKKFYEKAREEDLTLTHTFINPQVNRVATFFDTDEENIVAAQVVKRTNQGLIIKGARLLATQGGITDEILVVPAGAVDDAHAFAFAIPSNTKGLRFLCRESFVKDESSFNYPLSSRFEEMDTIVVFDNVLVPWERVFFYDNVDVASSFMNKSAYRALALHQVVARQVVKAEFFLGIVESIIETINIGVFQHVQDKVTEIIIALQTMKSFLISSESLAEKDEYGIMRPDENMLLSAIYTFPRIYPRFTEIVQLLGASGLISIPTEQDFQSEIKEDLEKYLQSATKDGYDRVKLFRLAWDLTMSSFGTRQTLYERFFFGDPVRLGRNIYHKYDKQPFVDWVNDFLNEKSDKE